MSDSKMQPLVLIVEDEAPLQELLAYNLQRADFEVEQAFDDYRRGRLVGAASG